MEKEQDYQPHPVFYEGKGYSQLKGFIEFHSRNSTKVYVLADQNTSRDCMWLLNEKLGQEGEVPVIEIPAGEDHKNLHTCENIWNTLTQWHADRNSILINLGGGVVCDIGGFAASVYKRGIRFIHIPTSLLAMTDAAIGGKNGVDLGVLKNMIGTFNQPLAVFIDHAFLNTLPEREVKNGFAEMLKHGLIAEESYFDELIESGAANITSEQVRLSVEIKSDIVIRDPFEKNFRKSLNFGHTIGHALESFSLENDESPLLHGEAVIIGIICETIISGKMNFLDDQQERKIITALLDFLPDYHLFEKDLENIMALIQHDKKNKGTRTGFTLIREPGKVLIDQYCPPELIYDALNQTASILGKK